ncbi:hypothetical protein TRFO_14711 [Tritrichomonas foetus]|uniref:Uncharacterized protein n=1 Tax=Tritrichomonas foetus TaxID=1144522 RepID=A0A1J4KUF9_9EUKA|nr:hypothetical protein TRFO_14711 [Tritrichomonas foetus]|eukprot:OHT14913.1 hypothetical protein TRFO_14711 [Tritrichomonas foetus]
MSTSFHSIFGINSIQTNDCTDEIIDIDAPKNHESSEIYQKLVDICFDPDSLVQLLNSQLKNHVLVQSAVHYTNFEQTQMLSPFLNILPCILSNKIIIAQSQKPQINIKSYLTAWQYFAFQSFYTYFQILLSSKIYSGRSREWVLCMLYENLLLEKKIFKTGNLLQVKIKDKIHKEKSIFLAIMESDQYVTIYNHNNLIASGNILFSSDSGNGICTLVDKENGTESQITLLNNDGKPIDCSYQDYLLSISKRNCSINKLISSCKVIGKQSPISLKVYDVIGKNIIAYDAEFLQAFYYLNSNDSKAFSSIMTISRFFDRHYFVVKTLIWVIIDNAKDPNDIFSSMFSPHHYLINFVQIASKVVVDRIMEKIIEFCKLSNDNDNYLKNDNFVIGLVRVFWNSLIHNFMGFPKIVFVLCLQILISTCKKFSTDVKNPYNGITSLMFNKVIIPLMLQHIENSGFARKAVIKLSAIICVTAKMGTQDKYSSIGRESLIFFLTRITSTTMGAKDIPKPSVTDFIEAVNHTLSYIKEHGKELKDIFALDNELVQDNSSDVSVNRPISSSKDQKRKIPKDVIPWKLMLAEDIVYSYFIQNDSSK